MGGASHGGRWVWVLVALCGVGWVPSLPAAAQSSRDHVAPSAWRPRLDKVEEAVAQGRWKAAVKQGARLEKDVLSRSWHGSELRQVLTELAFLQALAHANLDHDRQAIWYWHMAINSDFRVATRDLGPYGRAARLLLEHPLRKKGEVPAGFDPLPTSPTVKVVPAQLPPRHANAIILNNTGAALEHHGDFYAELIIDEQGVPHQPVVISSHLHPVILYASLKFLLDAPPLVPASIDGQPGDLLMTLRLQFEISRW